MGEAERGIRFHGKGNRHAKRPFPVSEDEKASPTARFGELPLHAFFRVLRTKETDDGTGSSLHEKAPEHDRDIRFRGAGGSGSDVQRLQENCSMR